MLLRPHPLPNTISLVGFYPNILGIYFVDKREGKGISESERGRKKNG